MTESCAATTASAAAGGAPRPPTTAPTTTPSGASRSHDDRRLFEKLCLEGVPVRALVADDPAQARGVPAGVRRASTSTQVAGFGARDVERLLGDAAIVRHRGKIEATINNAARAVELVEAEGSLAAYVWRFEPDRATPERLDRAGAAALAQSPESTALAKDLKRRGWRSSGRPRCTRSCRRWAWSTTT